MKILKDSRGFTAVELIVILIVIIGLAGAAYAFMKMRNDAAAPVSSTSTTTSPTSTSAAVSVPSAPQVDSSKDLDSALNTLNQTNLDDGNSDSSQLGSQSSNF